MGERGGVPRRWRRQCRPQSRSACVRRRSKLVCARARVYRCEEEWRPENRRTRRLEEEGLILPCERRTETNSKRWIEWQDAVRMRGKSWKGHGKCDRGTSWQVSQGPPPPRRSRSPSLPRERRWAAGPASSGPARTSGREWFFEIGFAESLKPARPIDP